MFSILVLAAYRHYARFPTAIAYDTTNRFLRPVPLHRSRKYLGRSENEENSSFSVSSVPSVALCFQFLSCLPLAIMPSFPLPLHDTQITNSWYRLYDTTNRFLLTCSAKSLAKSILVVRKTKKTLLSLCPLCPLWLHVFNSCPGFLSTLTTQQRKMALSLLSSDPFALFVPFVVL